MTETDLDDSTQSGIAVLADATNAFDGDAPWTVHGIAIPEGAVTTGRSGVETRWPADTLRAAADLLEGKPIVKNFHELAGQAPADDVIGQVTSTAYADGVGLMFEGEVSDEAIAQKIASGYLEVSPTMARRLGDVDEASGARTAEEITAFRDLAVVAEGASSGNEINMGANPAVSALSAEALSRAFGQGDGDGADDGGDGGEEGDGAGTMPAESGVDDSPGGAGGSDDPVGASSSGRDTDDDSTTMTDDDITDDERALLDAVDDPVQAREALAERDRFDDPHLTEKEQYEALQGDLEEAKAVFADALADRTGMSADTAAQLPWEALRAEFEDDDGDLSAEALMQVPETGDTDTGTDTDGSGGGVESLSRDERSAVKEKLDRASLLADRTPEHAEALRDEAAELAGVETADDIDMEAL